MSTVISLYAQRQTFAATVYWHIVKMKDESWIWLLEKKNGSPEIEN